MSKTLDFYFDFGSPTAYLAWTQLPAICAETGTRLVYRPMLLGAVFQATGNHSPVQVPAKGRYMFQDLARFARRYGVPLKLNPHFPVNTMTMMRAATGLLLRADPQFERYVEAMFRAMWVEARNMGDAPVLAASLADAGMDPAAVLALAGEPAVKEQLKQATEAAVARGVFGAPTMFVGDTLYWGQDRLDFVREALQQPD